MPQALSIVFGAAFTVAVCVALGRMLLRRLSVTLYRQEELPLAFVTGAACLSLIMFLLSAAGLVYDGVLLGAGVVVLALAVYSRAHLTTGGSFPALPARWKYVAGVIFTVFGTLYFCHAMAPEISPDGSTYHLGLVGRYYRGHGFERITTHMYANLSQGVEMLYLFAYAFGRHSAAALVHFAFLAALPLAMLSYARRFGFATAGIAASLFFFVSPVVGMDGSTAYNDVATACVLFCLFYLLQIWAQASTRGLLVPIGLVAGFCYACKYTAFLAVPYALLFVGWKLVRERKPFLRPLVLVSVCALLMIVPWMGKNWIWLDNPFSPFFNSVFENPYIHISFEKRYAQQMRDYPGLESSWDIPLEVTVHGATLCGLTGPLFLLAPLALAALRHPHGRKLLLAALVFGITYGTNIGTRFLIPPLPYISLALALAVSNIRGVALTLVIIHGIISWPDVLRTYCDTYAWKLDKVLYSEALRITSEDEFFRSNFQGYSVARMVEELVPPGEKVLTFTQIPEAYTTREILVVYQAAFNEVLGDMLWTPLISEAQPTRRIQFDFPPEALRAIRVVQTASDGTEQWSIAECRVFGEGRELPRTAGWRLRSNPNPWDVQRAFDLSSITRWGSWQSLFSGMFVEVHFPQAETVDSVVLESAGDQWSISLRLEGMDADGNWRTISASPTESEMTPPAGLRRAATAEIRNAGVRYLLIHEDEHGHEDYVQRKHEWGITQVGERYGKRLYRID